MQTDEVDTFHRDVKAVETDTLYGRNSAEFTSVQLPLRQATHCVGNVATCEDTSLVQSQQSCSASSGFSLHDSELLDSGTVSLSRIPPMRLRSIGEWVRKAPYGFY